MSLQINSTGLEEVNLSNCDKEPIHIPGKVQEHGFLLAVNRSAWTIAYASDNVTAYTGIALPAVFNTGIEDFISATGMKAGNANVFELIKYAAAKEAEDLNYITVYIKEKAFNLIVNHSGEYLLLEFEVADPEIDKALQQVMGMSLSKILNAQSITETLNFSAQQIKEIIHYDRVMVYKFWEDDHGEVVAEEKNDDLEPFLGLHYPASDIPRQARELYKINLVRIIADVFSTPSSLFAADEQLAVQALDLTHSTLRAVSPIHIEYLKNMGVASSFSISIVIKDRLWGLIACHNYSPRFIDYKARNSCKLICKVLSSALEYREEQERKETSAGFESVIQDIIKKFRRQWNITESLLSSPSDFLSVTNATGAALLFENQLYTLGETPDHTAINNLFQWIKNHNRFNIYHTDNLSRQYPPAADYMTQASGLLGFPLSWEMDEYIMWFKPAIKKSVRWAGNPDKPVEVDKNGQQLISPRRSFAEWSQEVTGSAAPWAAAEINAVMKLREEIIYAINEKANIVRRLNEELNKAYEELDTFSYTISHDLKTPLASIKNYTEILLEDNESLDPEVKKILGKVVRNADKMNFLITEILSYSRIGKQELRTQHLDMEQMLAGIRNEVLSAYKDSTAQVIIEGSPPIDGDGIMISQVFTNLIDNAVKYSQKTTAPKVVIRGQEKDGEIVYTIQDNGIGIDAASGDQVFELFKRLENVRGYDGTGVGLAIVKRIVERHKAKIWYESEPGKGTVFYLVFNKK
ncbi:ATP-binding protein [Ferruginibacter sp.]